MIASILLIILLGYGIFNWQPTVLITTMFILIMIFVPIKYLLYRFDIAIGSKNYLGAVKMKYKMLKDLDKVVPDNFIRIPMMDREFVCSQIGYCLDGNYKRYGRIDYIIVLSFIDYNKYKISRLLNLFSVNHSNKNDALITILEDVQREIERKK